MAFLIMFVIAFQLFFRYDYWNSKDDDGVVYERDKLTGEVHIIRPGERVDFLSRVVGKHIGSSLDSRHPDRDKTDKKSHVSPAGGHPEDLDDTDGTDNGDAPIPEAPQTMAMVDEASVPVVATTRPTAKTPAGDTEKTPAASGEGYALNKSLDLNKDGAMEKLIKTAEPGGDTSISIVTASGKEIFFARGKGIHILATRMEGWPDLALRQPGQSQQFYRFNPKSELYEVIHYQ
ncbi:MAG: hypothetical protein AB7P76_11405 [Candidatus Melainabacteria bacterium]